MQFSEHAPAFAFTIEHKWILFPLKFSRMRLAHDNKSKISADSSRWNRNSASSREIWPPDRTRSPSALILARFVASTNVAVMVDSIAVIMPSTSREFNGGCVRGADCLNPQRVVAANQRRNSSAKAFMAAASWDNSRSPGRPGVRRIGISRTRTRRKVY